METQTFFMAIAIIAICSFAGYFKMNTLSLFFMLGIFVLLFSPFIGSSMVILFSIIGGLVIGYVISQIMR